MDFLGLIKPFVLRYLNGSTNLIGAAAGLPVLIQGLGVSQYARTAAAEGGWWVQFYWTGVFEWTLVTSGLASMAFGYFVGKGKTS
jgi:hypothetical protein